MPWTTTIDRESGEKKTFFLDASFGCRKRLTAIWAGPNISQRIWEVRWNRSRHGSDMQSEKFGMRESAYKRRSELIRKGYKPEPVISHSNGLHTVIA